MATDPREYFSAAINITNYIPSLDDIQDKALTLKSTVVDIVKGRANSSGLAVHTVTFMKFEEWTCHNTTHYYLIIGTSTGFQVFLLHDARDREQKIPPQQSSATNLNAASASPNAPSTTNASPIMNPLHTPLMNGSPHHSPSIGAVSAKRKKFHKKALSASDNFSMIKVAPGGGKQQRQINNPISCAAIVRGPHKWEGPIIAVSPANEAHNFDSKCVRLYSLMEQQYVHVYRLRTRVHGILSRANALIIVTEKEIVVINPMTDEKLYRKTCAANPVNGVVASLGARWLAFADTKLRQTQIGTHMLPRNKKNYTSSTTPYSSPSKQAKIKQSVNDEETGEDEAHLMNEEDDEFGTLHTDYDEHTRRSSTGYELMMNASKTVTNTMSGTMKFIQDSLVETRKEVKNAVKKQQENMIRKRNELRAANPPQNTNNNLLSSNLYCDDAPSQGIISIIDYVSGDLLMNFVAHPSAPLMHIAFDDSGTLLVSADRDGIYLNVFQVIGYPMASLMKHTPQQPTVYRHLYRIYRGFRYAIIRDITFSRDSKWMAVSSARGTIHVYAINREGGVPMYSNDNIALNDALCVDIHQMYDLQSLKKLHHEMKETRKDQMGSTTTTGGTKIVSTFSSKGTTLSLFVQTPIAFDQYCIHSMEGTAVTTDENESEKQLYLEIQHLHKFSSRDLYYAQSVSYPYLHDQLYPESTPNVNPKYTMPSSITMSVFNLDLDSANHNEHKKEIVNESSNKKYDEDTKRWLANTELHPINRFNEVSLWGNPQFNFYSFLSADDDKQSIIMNQDKSNMSSESPELNDTQHTDPYAFLNMKHMEDAIPIKLHDDSPIIGSQMEVNYNAISDLQGTIDTAIGTVIERDVTSPPPSPLKPQQIDHHQLQSKTTSNESNKSSKNSNILPLVLNEEYANKLDEEDQTDSDDFQIVD
eukprot:126536_1